MVLRNCGEMQKCSRIKAHKAFLPRLYYDTFFIEKEK